MACLESAYPAYRVSLWGPTVTASSYDPFFEPPRAEPHYAAGGRGRGRHQIAAKGGRWYAADLIRVDWDRKGRGGVPGYPGPEPVPVFRVGNESRNPKRSRPPRPVSGLTMPRRNGAHG